MDFSILYALQDLRCDFLDQFFIILTKIAGSYGQVWLILAAALLIFKKTRKTGFTILLSYAFVFLIGQFILKDLIARPRPCHLDETIQLLVERPSSYSCPSTHSAWAFAASTSIACFHKKYSIIAFVAAILIAFSRLYLFVHFPTDVLLGIVLGILCGLAASPIVKAIDKKIRAKKASKA